MKVEEFLACLHKPIGVPRSLQRYDADNDLKFAGESMANQGRRKPGGYQSGFHPITGKWIRGKE